MKDNHGDQFSHDRFIRMNDALWRALKTYADEHGLPVSVVIRRASITWLKRQGWPAEIDSPRQARQVSANRRDGAFRRLITVRQASELLDVSRTTIYNWLADGTLSAVETPPGVTRGQYLKLSDVQRLARRRES